MLYVPAEVRSSSIHGVGLFATEFVPSGALISKWTAGFDQQFDEVALVALPAHVQRTVRTHGWRLRSGVWRRDADAAMYVNHSDRPNTFVRGKEDDCPTFALCDIGSGEEITENYGQWDDHFMGF